MFSVRVCVSVREVCFQERLCCVCWLGCVFSACVCVCVWAACFWGRFVTGVRLAGIPSTLCLWGVSPTCLLSSSSCVCVSVCPFRDRCPQLHEQMVFAFSLPVCGLVTWVCELLCGFLVLASRDLRGVLSFQWCPAGPYFVWCFQGRRGHGVSPGKPPASRATRPVASVLSGGRVCGVSPCRLVPRWLGAGCGGRAGQGLWWALDPRPDLGINIPAAGGCVYSAPARGRRQPGRSRGRGVTRPQRRHFLLARQATASLPLPAPFRDGGVAATPHPGLPGPLVTLWTSSRGFPGSGGRRRGAGGRE